MGRYRRLWDTYRFAGFSPQHTVCGIFGEPGARVIRLVRRGKKRPAECAVLFTIRSTTERSEVYGICPAETCASTWKWRCAGYRVEGARK
jgi:hypothetical protein